MNPKEVAEAYIKIAEVAASRHDKRRDIEWKISFAVWISLLTPYWSQKTLTFTFLGPPVVTALVFTLAYSYLWIKPLWEANMSDKQLVDHAWKTAERVLRTGDARNLEEPPTKCKSSLLSPAFLSDWAMRFHCLITLCLSILFTRGVIEASVR